MLFGMMETQEQKKHPKEETANNFILFGLALVDNEEQTKQQQYAIKEEF